MQIFRPLCFLGLASALMLSCSNDPQLVVTPPDSSMPQIAPIEFEVERTPDSVRLRLELPQGWQDFPGERKGVGLFIDQDRNSTTGRRFWGDVGTDVVCWFTFVSPGHPWNGTVVVDHNNNETYSWGSFHIDGSSLELEYPLVLESPFDYVLMIFNREELDGRNQTNWFAPESAVSKHGHLESN